MRSARAAATFLFRAYHTTFCGRSNVVKDDIKDVGELFLDAKSSALMLEKNADKYMK